MKFVNGCGKNFIMNADGSFTIMGVNAFTGEAITKTKYTHPYSYEPFEVYSNKEVDTDSSAYDDRMRSWDWDRFADGCNLVFGDRAQTFSTRSADKIEEFLRYYFKKPNLILTRIVEGCNVANGYPYWYFEWNNGGTYNEE